MRKLLSTVISLVLLNLNAAPLWAASAARVENVEVSPDAVVVTTDRPVHYDVFTVTEPPRVVLELLNTKAGSDAKYAGAGRIKSVRAGQYQEKPHTISRVVLQLSEKTAYDVVSNGNTIAVMLKNAEPGETVAAKPLPVPAAIEASAPATAPAPAPKAELLAKAEVPQKAPEAVPAVAEEKPEPAPEAKRHETAKAKPDLRRADGDGLRAAPATSPKPVHPKTGDILLDMPTDLQNLEYNGVDLREVLDEMGSVMGVNMVYADDVGGDITIKLQNVPFNEAFNAILSIKGLGAQQLGGNILRIASSQTIANERSRSPLITRVFPVNFIKVDNAKSMVAGMIAAEKRSGSVYADPSNNLLIVTDVPSAMQDIEKFINQIDRKPKQILIEAKLVEVNLNSGFTLGISWGAYGGSKSTIGGQNGLNYFGSGSTSNQAYNNSGITTSGIVTPYDGSQTIYSPIPNNGSSNGTGVSFPSIANEVTGAAFRFGRITDSYSLDVKISAAQQNGKVKVLSDPKVATLNNVPAKINIQTSIPWTTTDITQGAAAVQSQKVSYTNTGISLDVTPTVNADGKVTMVLNPKVSQVASTIATAAGGAPGVDSREANTTVLVSDGETVVIGGMIYDNSSDTVYKVPLLGDIPLLGWFFKKKATTRQRLELLIFVTPKIID